MSIVSESLQPAEQTCTCAHRTVAGVTFRWSNNPGCQLHGEHSESFDWKAFNQMSGRDLPSDDVKLNCGDVEGRFGRIP